MLWFVTVKIFEINILGYLLYTTYFMGKKSWIMLQFCLSSRNQNTVKRIQSFSPFLTIPVNLKQFHTCWGTKWLQQLQHIPLESTSKIDFQTKKSELPVARSNSNIWQCSYRWQQNYPKPIVGLIMNRLRQKLALSPVKKLFSKRNTALPLVSSFQGIEWNLYGRKLSRHF